MQMRWGPLPSPHVFRSVINLINLRPRLRRAPSKLSFRTRSAAVKFFAAFYMGKNNYPSAKQDFSALLKRPPPTFWEGKQFWIKKTQRSFLWFWAKFARNNPLPMLSFSPRTHKETHIISCFANISSWHFPQLIHTHFFDSALHKTGRGISLSFRVIFCLRKISKDIWLHQNISSIRMKIPISFLYHLKGSSCVSPECVSCLGSYPQKRTEKDENFSVITKFCQVFHVT